MFGVGVFSFVLGRYLGVELLDHVDPLCVTFEDLADFFTVAVPFSIPPTLLRFPVFHSLVSTDFLIFCFLFFIKILFIFRERGREGEKHQCVVPSRAPSTGDLACNPGTCLTGNQTNDPLFAG